MYEAEGRSQSMGEGGAPPAGGGTPTRPGSTVRDPEIRDIIRIDRPGTLEFSGPMTVTDIQYSFIICPMHRMKNRLKTRSSTILHYVAWNYL